MEENGVGVQCRCGPGVIDGVLHSVARDMGLPDDRRDGR
jgi:hypothetical protein